MKSQLPRAKLVPGQEKRGKSRPDDGSTVHTALTRLGAPYLTTEEFNRLYRGPLADALLFVSEHVRGRRQVALARNQIQRLRETRAKSRLRQPDDLTYTAADKAASSLSTARESSNVYRKQLDNFQAAVDESQNKIDQMKKELEDKRRHAFLLSVLEMKEKLRVQRFREMTRLMSDLRKAVAKSKSQVTHPQIPRLTCGLFDPQATSMISRRFRISHTRDVLTNMHAHHIRVTQIIKHEHESSSELISRLRKSIAQKNGRLETDAQTTIILDQLIASARLQAERMIRYLAQPLTGYPAVTKSDLEDKLSANKVKEQELQQVADLSLALGFLSEYFISSISLFLEKTSHVLRSSLEEEAALTKGYVDIMRCSIAKDSAWEVQERSFMQDVRSACGMRGTGAPNAIILEVERLIQMARRQASFLELSAVPQSIPVMPDQDALVASYQANTRCTRDRAVKLLTRKVEKADMGYSLVRDVETLLREARDIVG